MLHIFLCSYLLPYICDILNNYASIKHNCMEVEELMDVCKDRIKWHILHLPLLRTTGVTIKYVL